MNENLNLCEILKDCPKGWKFYSTIYGEVEFEKIKKESEYPIVIITKHGNNSYIKSDGRYYGEFDGECTLFPSREQRDWSKFKVKKPRFDPKTLKPFDKVLVLDSDRPWTPLLFSYLEYSLNYPRMQCFDFAARKVVPYNKETEHLVGTYDEAPEFYRYWED